MPSLIFHSIPAAVAIGLTSYTCTCNRGEHESYPYLEATLKA